MIKFSVKLCELCVSVLKKNSPIPFLFFIFHFSFFIETQATIRYVRENGTGTGTGSWVNASADLQLMINQSNAGDTLWVAAGTYLPIRPANNLNTIDSNNRLNSFVLKANVAIFGGFEGNETDLSQRNWHTNPTILSGDIGRPNNMSDNCYRVVLSLGNVRATCLDGFTITKGNGNGDYIIINGYIINSFGGGVQCLNSSPMLTNLTINGNIASSFGGGIHIENSSPQLTNVVVSGNCATNGGGISTLAVCSPIFTQVTISGNRAVGGGGGGIINNAQSSLSIRNSIIWGNTAGGNADNVANAGGNIVYSNSLVGIDPLFVAPVPASNAPTSAGDYRLSSCSPAIDKGNNAYITDITMDLDCNPRIYNEIVDLGAYEWNYELAYDSILFTSLSFIYSGKGQVPEATTLNGHTPSLLYKEKNASDYTYSSIPPIKAGNYIVKASLSRPEICITDYADFVILPKDIVVKANGGSSIYGENPTNPKFIAIGLVNGETEKILTGLSNDFSIDSTTPAGTYMLSVVGTQTNTNYNVIEYDTGIWVVNKRPLTIRAINDTVYYGQTPVLKYEIVSGSLVNGDVLSGSLYVDNYEVGTHIIKQGTLTAGNNYAITFIEGTLVVWSIQDVLVDNKLAERHKNYFYFNSECGKEKANVYVTCYQCVKTLINGRKENPSLVSLPYYGDNEVIITVIAGNGDAETHTLTINKPIPFDTIVKMHCDNTLTVNNNPATNGGFRFTSYKWFCNERQFSENPSWTANSGKEWWNPSDLFHVELTAEGYSGIFRTCKGKISLKDMELVFYPNPVFVGKTLYIKGDLSDACLKDAVIEVYDMRGRLVETQLVVSLQIPIEYRYRPGVYLFRLKWKDGAKKEVKVVVYE